MQLRYVMKIPFLPLILLIAVLMCMSLSITSCDVTVHPDGAKTYSPRADIIVPAINAVKPIEPCDAKGSR